ncbi:hypothetical protein FHL15_010364 [Xylaria flabelliformis]|uniref:Uncharacterized protein n=1 Tax=Xylaria flabelliformis TaxID=2512241 RepID=A0A553HLF6_9PEZI|nr:hypothetical protein FHL15_010364 [Xylaria flabelliformis]
MSHSTSLHDLRTQLEEGVMGLSLVKGRLNMILDWIEVNLSDPRQLPVIVFKLAGEVDALSGETQKCAKLHEDLDRLNNELNRRQRSLDQQLQNVASIQGQVKDGIKSYHGKLEVSLKDLGKKLDSQNLQLKGLDPIDKKLMGCQQHVEGTLEDFNKKLDVIKAEMSNSRQSIESTIQSEFQSVDIHATQKAILNNLVEMKDHLQLSDQITSKSSNDASSSSDGNKTGLLISGVEPVWQASLGVIQEALNVYLEDEEGLKHVKRTRRLLINCLGYKHKSPEVFLDYLNDDHHKQQWICIATLCNGRGFFYPKQDDGYCSDCSKMGSTACIQVKKEKPRQAFLRVARWDE